MEKLKYSDLVLEFSRNSLLHLYLQVASADRMIPKKRRNEILVKWMKPLVKDSRYKLIKKDIQSYIQRARKNYSVEEALCRVVDDYASLSLDDTHCSQLFDLLQTLEAKHNISSKLNEHTKSGNIVLDKAAINTAFDTTNQIAPLYFELEGITFKTLEKALMSLDACFKVFQEEFEGQTRYCFQHKDSQFTIH
ncbi:DUF2913 family protein [Vibrio mediterranei]|uniref:DUF2913 family protein n=1 Tax=Vibrio mediterranei TaxID=689 RepID=UPI0040684CF2